MPDVKRTESIELRRGPRRRDPEVQPDATSRYTPQPEAPDRDPQHSADALQKDPSPSATPDDGARFERVRQRAYELFVNRGNATGDEVADWLEAERQIDAEPRR